MALNILTQKKFVTDIDKLVVDKKLTYMDAIVHYCESNEVEIETAANLISPKMKCSIEMEAMDLNIIPKKARLDFGD
jgi:hypothetical protein